MDEEFKKISNPVELAKYIKEKYPDSIGTSISKDFFS